MNTSSGSSHKDVHETSSAVLAADKRQLEDGTLYRLARVGSSTKGFLIYMGCIWCLRYQVFRDQCSEDKDRCSDLATIALLVGTVTYAAALHFTRSARKAN